MSECIPELVNAQGLIKTVSTVKDFSWIAVPAGHHPTISSVEVTEQMLCGWPHLLKSGDTMNGAHSLCVCIEDTVL